MPARVRTVILLAIWWLGGASLGAAQVPENSRADSLAAVLHRLTARIDSLESGHCPDTTSLALPAPSGNARTDSLLAVTAELDRRLRALRDQRCAAAAPARAAPRADTTDELAALRAAAAGAAGRRRRGRRHTGRYQCRPAARPRAAGASATPPPSTPRSAPRATFAWSPARTSARQRRGPGVRGGAAVHSRSLFHRQDLPHLRGRGGRASRRATSTGPAFPGRLRVDVGKFRQQVGDLNRWHLHALPETEYPLVYQRFLGDEGLSGRRPLPLHRAPGFARRRHPRDLGAGDHGGERSALRRRRTTHRPASGCRTSGSSAGAPTARSASPALGGDNPDSDLTSRLLGLDFRLTWRPPEAGTRRDLTFRAEGYRLHATEAGITTRLATAASSTSTPGSASAGSSATRYDYVEAPRGARRRPNGGSHPPSPGGRVSSSTSGWKGSTATTNSTAPTTCLPLQAVFAMGPHKHETY